MIEEKLVEWATEIKNVVSQELPLFAQEIINYKFYSYLTEFVFVFSIFCLCIYFLYACLKYEKQKGNSNLDGLYVIVTILCLICFIDILCITNSLIKILFAPRLYLFEYIMDLVKK